MSLNVVIVGAVALGPKTACRLKRLMPDAHVTLIDRDELVSYGGCGIPYFVSGDISDAKELMSTSFHMVRDERFFKTAKDVDVLTRAEVLAIDRAAKTVQVKDLRSGDERIISYDKLVLATGSQPNRPSIPGVDLPGVYTVSNLAEAIAIKEMIASGNVGRAVVIGGGAIGLEMVEALSDLWGVETALIEVQNQLLPGIVSPVMAKMIQQHLAEHEVEEIYLDEKVLRIEGGDRVERVVTDHRQLTVDMVIMAAGVHPSVELAKQAGLEISETGAIQVDESFNTSDPDILAGGDCVDNLHLITGQRVYYPSGALANRQGRIIGTNLAGGSETFPGIVGSFILKAFEIAVAAAGLSLVRAKEAGFDADSAFVIQADKAHFFPTAELMYLELVFDRSSGQVLGIAGLSSQGDALATRVDAVAAILKYKPTIKDISDLELAYAPPFSSAMDILNALGNTAENIRGGLNKTMEVDEFCSLFEAENNGEFICLDVRGQANAQPYVEKFPGRWINIPQDELRDRLDEVPRDKKLVMVCNSGVRSFEAQITLDHLGIGPTRNLQGGVGALKKYGMKLLDE